VAAEEDDRPMFAIEIHTQLQELQVERALASLEGLTDHDDYMADLDHEIAAARHAYVGAAVTEIASLRAQLSGPQVG
jgi:HAMP domain-containing protein